MRRIIVFAWLLAGCSQVAGTIQPDDAATRQTAPKPAATNTARPATAAPTAAPTAIARPPATPAGPPTITAIPPTILRATATRPPPQPAVPTAPPAPPPATSRPAAELSYVFPVQPAANAEYGICHHDYPASDIFAPLGTQFVAVTSGTIDWVTREDVWDAQINDPPTRGGLSVALIGDDGVRYYGSHLVEVAAGIEPGARVGAGQLLGLIGKSGDAVNTPYHVHFGISHPTSAADWQVRRGAINPYPYLNAWRNGQQITPDLAVVGGGAC